ncbi:MAG: hypothetical protein RBT65_10850 [Methanolobus sp.]|nr:hypothetical protein [Methanolobus sp.]
MAWYDVGLGVATGGLYTAGKAIYQAGNAADDIGGAAEEAGLALAVIGSTIEAVGEQLESTLKEAEELLTIKRLTPRSEDDLWDEEKARLSYLRLEETRLKNKLKDMGVSDPTDFSFDFWDFISNMQDILEKFQTMARLAAVRKEISDIFYQEPGVLTNSIYNAKEVLERLNTIEQPLLEDILISLDDNLDVSEEVLLEVKKLFVTKKKVPVSIADLSPSIQGQLEMIRKDKQYYAGLIERKDTVTSQLGDIIKVFPASKFEISTGSIVMAGLKIKDTGIAGGITHVDESIREDVATGIDSTTVDVSEIAENIGIRERENEGITRPVQVRENIRNLATERPAVNIAASTEAADSSAKTETAKINMEAVSSMRLAVKSMPQHSMATMQPHGAKVSASLSTKFDGYQRNYDLMKAQKAFYFRQSLKMEKKYERISNKWIEEPGIIPKTLDELHGVLENVRTEEQPRIDLLLDNVNITLVEAKVTVQKANDTMDSVKNALSILDFDTKYLKMGGMVIGGLVVFNLLFGLIVLIRMALGF